MPGGGFLPSEPDQLHKHREWRDERYPPPTNPTPPAQDVMEPQSDKPKPSRAKTARGSLDAQSATPADGKADVAARAEYEQARRSLIRFACAIDVPGRPVSDDSEDPLYAKIETALAPHHRLLLDKVQKVVETPSGRAMILMPPGSAKSTYCSVVLPTFLMGRRKDCRIILASYGTDLARKHGRRARAIVRSATYQAIFNTTPSREASAADGWALSNGSEYMATGINSGVTGNRANGLIIDDPVKGREDADSELIRRKTREAYEDDLKTRLLPGGWIILIQTRWHEDDLAGSILPERWAGESGSLLCRDGKVWDVVCLPAKCDRADDPLGRSIGEFLWPEWFDRAHWEEFERNPRTWSALYQQKPAPDTGIFFEAPWLKTYHTMPARETLSVYGASDYAVTEGRGDYTVHIVVGVDPAGRLYVLDLWRGQTASNVWVEVLCDLIRRWKPIAWGEETGQIRAGIGPFLDQRLRERRAYVARKAFPARGNKETRAQAIRGRIALDGLYVPSSAQITAGVVLGPEPALRGDFSNAPPALLALRPAGPQVVRSTKDSAPTPVPDFAEHTPDQPLGVRDEWVADFRYELLHFPHGRNDDQVDALSLIGQLLDIMIKGKPKPEPTQFRGANEITMDEIWEHGRLKPPGSDWGV
jgi:phage terminase large subunit-like protein